MVTVIIDDGNKEHEIVTQQYQVGLYVIIDSNPSLQFGFKTEEKEYHRKLRKKYNYNPDKSSIL